VTVQRLDAGTLADWRAHAARCRRRMDAADCWVLLGRLEAALDEVDRLRPRQWPLFAAHGEEAPS
jgi:hypothetical protein